MKNRSLNAILLSDMTNEELQTCIVEIVATATEAARLLLKSTKMLCDADALVPRDTAEGAEWHTEMERHSAITIYKLEGIQNDLDRLQR